MKYKISRLAYEIIKEFINKDIHYVMRNNNYIIFKEDREDIVVEKIETDSILGNQFQFLKSYHYYSLNEILENTIFVQ